MEQQGMKERALVLRDLPWLGPALAAAQARLSGVRPGSRIVVFYDGECGMCNAFVRLLLRAGIPPNLYFSSQQGATWQALLLEQPWLKEIDTVAVLTEDGGERTVRVRSEAVLWTLAQFRSPLALAWFAMLVPMPLLNLGYRVIARFRRQISGALLSTVCALPPAELRSRFLD
jgi:predicted DCC family thiol-disulfide oxidoreductase YuxK